MRNVPEKKPIKRKKGRYIIQYPYTSSYPQPYPDMANTVDYLETINGWDFGFSGDIRVLQKTMGGMDKVLDDFGFDLACAREVVSMYWAPEQLRILDTKTMQVVPNELATVDVPAMKPKRMTQIDIFGN